MTIAFSNPNGVHAPGSRYSHAALVQGGGRRLVISGQIGVAPDGTVLPGGERQIAQALANLGAVLAAHGMGPANIVKLGVFVNSTPAFTDQPKVANGASELMQDVFGEPGRHARSAVGVASLPLGVAVEVDAIVAVRP